MGELDIQGARRRRRSKKTTVSDDRLARLSDLVDRQFRATGTQPALGGGPHLREESIWLRLRRRRLQSAIVRWLVSTSLRIDLAIDAQEMALHS
jgi:hypothetical protein